MKLPISDKTFIERTAVSIMQTVLSNFSAIGGCPHCLIREIAIQAVTSYAYNYDDASDLINEIVQAAADIKEVKNKKQNAPSTCTRQ